MEQDFEDSKLKDEIDQISQRIDTIVCRIDECDPAKQKDTDQAPEKLEQDSIKSIA